MNGTVQRIPSLGFARGAIVRRVEDGRNMLVVRGLGETTAVIVIESDHAGSVRIREFPTADLHQVLASGTPEPAPALLSDQPNPTDHQST